MALFNVLFDIAARTASFESSMNRIEQRFNSLTSLAKGAGAAIGVSLSVEGIVSKFNQVLDSAQQISRAMDRIGASSESLSQLRYAAGTAGVSFEQLSTSLSKMQRTISQSNGDDTVFAKIGVDLGKLKTLSPDKQFEAIAEAISRIKDPSDRANAAIAIFGRSGADLLPLLTQGASGIEKLRKESDTLGQTLDKLTTKNLADAKVAIDKMDKSWNALFTTVAAKVAPALTALADNLRKLAGGATDVEKLQQRLQSLEAMLSGGRTNAREIPAIKATIDAVKQQLADAQELTENKLTPVDISDVLTKALGFGPDQLQEIHISATRMETSVQDIIREYYLGLQDSTQSEVEHFESKYTEFKFQINQLLGAGLISPTTAQQRTDAFIADNLLPNLQEIQPRFQMMQTEAQKTWAAITDAEHAASVQMANSFEQFFANPMKTGLKGLGEAFIQTIDQMVAKEATLKLFGSDSSSGVLGSMFSSLFSFFGGHMADGGPLSAGKWYIAGEHGPEPIWGGGSGAYAAGYGGGASAPISVTFQVDARGATQDAVQMLPGAMKQASDNAVQRVIDLRRRGQL